MAESGQNSRRTAEQLLNSWKAIAAYLGRNVRTVQRWEHSEGLPVRRHGHDRGATVYADRSEIDAWLETRQIGSLYENGGVPVTTPLMRRKIAIAAAIGSAGLLLGLLGWWQLDSANQLVADVSNEPAAVLVADVQNRTGEADIGGPIQAALLRELNSSASFYVVPQGRIDETLALMRRSSETQLDMETGREVAVRDGAISAVFGARVGTLGEGYILSAEIQDPDSGTVVASVSEEANGAEQVSRIAQVLSSRIRRVAERSKALPAEPSMPLERVTTASLDALKLYSQAMAISLDHSLTASWSPIAERLLLHAIEYDQDFASALILLAWSIRNQNPVSNRYLPYAKRAFSLADDLNDRESYFVRGSYYQMVGDDEQAYKEYSVLVGLYPDHYWGLNNLANVLLRQGRTDEAARYLVSKADLPSASSTDASAAARTLIVAGHPAEAQQYAARARDLLLSERLPDATENFSVLATRWRAELADADVMWKSGDAEGAEQALASVRRKLEALEPNERDILSNLLAEMYVALGQIDAAEGVLAYRSNGLSHVDFLAIPVGAEVPSQAVTRDGIPPETSFLFLLYRAIEMARTGQPIEARLQLETAVARRPSRPADDRFGLQAAADGAFLITEGEILRAEGDYEVAEDRLVQALAGRYALPSLPWIAAESVAILRERRGDIAGAIQILENSGALRPLDEVDTGFEAIFWMRNRWRLAGLLRDTEPLVATSIEKELGALLAIADADHPVARALRERMRQE